MRKILVTLLFTLSSLLVWSSAVKAERLKLGDPAPDFTLENQYGENISLEAQLGHWVVLYFYPK
ncbi:MAG: redoxin domain-containing protein, partial [Thiomicrorhabdus sp.]|nr:redoxin domain-containing protein [Thiomicrorhabdus sp.]